MALNNELNKAVNAGPVKISRFGVRYLFQNGRFHQTFRVTSPFQVCTGRYSHRYVK
jgi:hypothetical protein